VWPQVAEPEIICTVPVEASALTREVARGICGKIIPITANRMSGTGDAGHAP